ncbi:EmrB/QacA subfamily drug resistance transporter [Sphingomonas kyeonggiensis]|uniref:EmrB/QacA subfamily drug resistance transporter n=1 Tax=Sphingomonas kyeonggiensis TaxID=1268553 RepID=A0A7W7K1H4_9SPHN|nr:MFS transporter [Sphingomonas kyeonggiensis]MBB4839287.1 EmrB/QacA subfamily drug resistance transporter [Sphingomonas kyeonggiensis]
MQARHPNLTLTACILASSLAFIDGSVTNVALPAIGADLHATPAELQWTINAYMLPLSALLLIGGAAGDHFGRRKLLVLGIALFTIASVACAVAADLTLLLAARALQGIGAAILLPNSLATLGHAFTGEARGKAIGTWAGVGAIAGAVGPPLGGWLVDMIGWRAIFYVNVPVALAAIAIALFYVEESSEGDLPLDLPGALTATLALGALTWALTLWSSHHAIDATVAIGLAAGLAAIGLFLWIEHHRGSRAMMPVAMFGSRAFAGLTLLTFLLYGALGGVLLLLPYVLIEAGGYSALHAGFALLPMPLGMGIASRIMGRITARVGPRWPLTIGPMIVAIGFALLLLVDEDAPYWTSVFPGALAIAIGMASVAAPLTTAVLASVDDTHTGTASGFNSAIARTGGLIATAIAGAVIASAGAGLVSAFHMGALVGAAAAALSGVTAFFTLGEVKKPKPQPR